MREDSKGGAMFCEHAKPRAGVEKLSLTESSHLRQIGNIAPMGRWRFNAEFDKMKMN